LTEAGPGHNNNNVTRNYLLKKNDMRLAAVFIVASLIVLPATALSKVITVLPGTDKVVALTFDACPTRPPQHFDKVVLDYLLEEKLPATLFISTWFARKNSDEIKKLAAVDFIEIENHSVSHNNHMESLSEADILKEIDDAYLAGLIGKKTKFFRFPAGNYDDRTLALVERQYRVVHWSFASGDPVPNLSARMLIDTVLARVRSGSILIFHINGKGHATGAALPEIVGALKKRGFRFVKLEDVLR
jgi:peptidoglycan-N-acetylglucosamine deacetylase